MKALGTDEIRSRFVAFFAERGHQAVTSSPLVPANDATLLFTNAGMVQFKDVFTGKEKRPYTRAVTAQKCVRAGGKHNDLENVGFTARHHTFFEMLGNFSFGDYFKEDAIQYAWTLVTEVLGLPPERLAVTIFKGEDGIPRDDEAAAMWRKAGVPEERIYALGKADNYWQMGDTGPQGPCSEIHYFTGDPSEPDYLSEDRVANSRGWLEIWNLVFMQFSKDTATSPLVPLPKPSIDTGAGLERVAMVLQGKSSTYDTDAFLPYIQAIAEELGKTYGGFPGEADDVSMRVIADHSRAAAFLIADGVQPSNEGRGYVLRRIMRRAIRHGARLGYDDLFFQRACGRVIDRMKAAYPDLERARTLITKVAESEETAFRRTLDRGLKMLGDAMNRAKLEHQSALDPTFVATLYHTYGFPIDLTRVVAAENGLAVDEVKANEAVKNANPESNEASLGAGVEIDKVWFEVLEKVGASEFVGYDSDDIDAKVRAIVKAGQPVDRASAGDTVHVVLDRTPFYGESGGQVGDRGTLTFGDGGKLSVKDAQKPRPDLVVHVGKVDEGTLAVGDTVHAHIDRTAREATRRNHSATHLLHLALKEVLGDHVQQKGSLVAPDRLRFDYAHFESVSAEQIDRIEQRVNQMVLEDAATETALGSIDDARKAGATMLFGEKYGDRVRMVRIGRESLELCGGTHVRRSGEIGLFKVISDGALAAGVRRLEAVTGLGALRWAQGQMRLLQAASSVLRAPADALPDRIEKLMKRTKELEREIEKVRAEAAIGGGKRGGDLLDTAESIGGAKVLLHRAEGTPRKALREMSDKLRDRLQSGVVVLATIADGKAALLVAVTKDLTPRIDAGALVKAAVEAMEGSGGGRADFAQGGGKPELLDAGLARIRAALAAT